jgi:hypothetical protein
MRYYLPNDIAHQTAADLHAMPERIGASPQVALAYAHLLMTMHYAIEHDLDESNRKLARHNSFEQTEALVRDILDGPIGRAALRVLMRNRVEMATTVHPWLTTELHTIGSTDVRASGEATMAVLDRWVDREWPRLAAEIAAELSAAGPTAAA